MTQTVSRMMGSKLQGCSGSCGDDDEISSVPCGAPDAVPRANNCVNEESEYDFTSGAETGGEASPVDGRSGSRKKRRDAMSQTFTSEHGEPSALENALRTAPSRPSEHVFEPHLGLLFDSEVEAFQFYNFYSWELGFNIKYGYNTGTHQIYYAVWMPG
uniref:Uncharacterized protein n=1 Tax=Oryza meridionalis TaxID=40149 RepID=A0A0E0D2U9_9ORYZ